MGADYTTRIDGELTTGVAPSANPSDWDPEEELMDDLAS
jgi:hypothetical protein